MIRCKIHDGSAKITMALCHDHIKFLEGRLIDVDRGLFDEKIECGLCQEGDPIELSTLEAVNNARIRQGWVPLTLGDMR